ncbi:hypothetical protein NKR23_g7921 [Pleurostoma richardsiae]|uniref:Uncharacterized protein n=1 Tax=Pleurostoma richardsiae TaxID=41990 RepID=A0AA38RV05_9PEZI|nr:hypothetical protein NKR23_g7921 [Pleurostoma richardsiae]
MRHTTLVLLFAALASGLMLPARDATEPSATTTVEPGPTPTLGPPYTTVPPDCLAVNGSVQCLGGEQYCGYCPACQNPPRGTAGYGIFPLGTRCS